MFILKEKFKAIFESTFIIVVFSLGGLAINEILIQPFAKLVFVSLFFLGWFVLLIYGLIYKESYMFKCSVKSRLFIYLAEQFIYCSLIIITGIVLFRAMYT